MPTAPEGSEARLRRSRRKGFEGVAIDRHLELSSFAATLGTQGVACTIGASSSNFGEFAARDTHLTNMTQRLSAACTTFQGRQAERYQWIIVGICMGLTATAAAGRARTVKVQTGN